MVSKCLHWKCVVFRQVSDSVPPILQPSENLTMVMRRLMAGIRSEKRVVRRFRLCANITDCTYTSLDSIAYYTPRLHGVAYCC
jgi:hypothetical protein